jgi:hypothetical protein
MIEKRYTLNQDQFDAMQVIGELGALEAVTWNDAEGRSLVGRAGDNPNDPQSIFVVQSSGDEVELVLCGRPLTELTADVERHIIRKAV